MAKRVTVQNLTCRRGMDKKVTFQYGSGYTSVVGLGASTSSTGQPASDWRTGKSLTESLYHIFSGGIGSDVTFLVGAKRQRIPAHTLILTSRSPVFFAMFNGPLAETGDVKVPDITVEAFTLFLTYLYTDEVTLTVGTVVSVMSVARKYCVDVLVSVCDNFLMTNFSPAIACFLLEQAHIYTEDRLMAMCLNSIGLSPEKMLTSESFAVLCPSCLTSITESDELDVDESHVYKAVMQWAEKECIRQNLEITGANKRAVLGNVLSTIRFPIMSQDFFLDQVCKDKILTSDEIVDILMYIRNNTNTLVTSFNKSYRKHYVRHGRPIFEKVHKVGKRPNCW
ncbi:BTB/POZ domain-containing protein 1-like isoform X1 [Mizuhopecten yessoensis]|nr:BTB/POZ domain-containing protein 1-like isoform X1 [Mizuhopecten yessoensis]XP_021375819.1 BTB/POZ domain-containing protein 1-like isoform X1 [Mizuhopecten yessoensis]